MPQNKPILDSVGKVLMSEVRDRALQKVFDSLHGKYKSTRLSAIAINRADFTNEEDLRRLITTSVDEAIGNLLVVLDHQPNLKLFAKADDGSLADVAKDSDGLLGELFGDSGWLARFSKHPSSFD